MARRAVKTLFNEIHLLKQEIRMIRKPRLSLEDLLPAPSSEYSVRLVSNVRLNPKAVEFTPVLDLPCSALGITVKVPRLDEADSAPRPPTGLQDFSEY